MNDHKQELFDRVAVHLLTQEVKSCSDENDRCLYRAGDLRCAVGCLIDDAHYYEGLEHHAVRQRLVVDAVEASLGYQLTDADVLLLEKLQYVHDCQDPYDWAVDLELVAEANDLSMPKVI